MTQNQAFTIIVKHQGLRSAIFVSRADLVSSVVPMPNEGDFQGVAVKVAVNVLQPGDYVVRSVCNNGRRSFEVLAGAVPASVVASLPEFANVEENLFVVPASAVSEDQLVATAGLEVRTHFAAGLVPEEPVVNVDEGSHDERSAIVLAHSIAKAAVVNDVVVLTDGQAVVEFPGAVRVN